LASACSSLPAAGAINGGARVLDSLERRQLRQLGGKLIG